jgi:hypothetical protein
MIGTTDQETTMTREFAWACEDRKTCTGIIAEYLEMPGLCLTLSQASRLWDIEPDTCAQALGRLVASGFLKKSGDLYVRAHDGRRAA